MALEITATKDGPYRVRGDLTDLTVLDASGQPFDLTGKKTVFLCRCGGSTTKPFCDGQHSRIGFTAVEEAVRNDDSEPGAR
jgi:3-phenylpropionate/trans-cinnamate dioxygenase ferredoxin subunit